MYKTLTHDRNNLFESTINKSYKKYNMQYV